MRLYTDPVAGDERAADLAAGLDQRKGALPVEVGNDSIEEK
jgi:hypothetical protein